MRRILSAGFSSRHTLLGTSLAAALLVGAIGLAPSEANEHFVRALGLLQPREPVAAPDFTLPGLNGKSVSLKDFRGRVVLMNFWATWCVPCQWEMPEMDKLYQAFKDRGFVVFAISLDQGPPKAVEDFVKARKLTYPVLLDSQAEAARLYGLRGVPGTYLIGSDGMLRYAVVGPKEWFGEEAKELIASLLPPTKKGGGKAK